MKIGITEIPDDFLMADGDKRWRRINVLANSMPPKIRVVLHSTISPIPLSDSEVGTTYALRVAVYERTECRGKYDEYEYRGDFYA